MRPASRRKGTPKPNKRKSDAGAKNKGGATNDKEKVSMPKEGRAETQAASKEGGAETPLRSCLKFQQEHKKYDHTVIVTFDILVYKTPGKLVKQLFEGRLRHLLEFGRKHACNGNSDLAILSRDPEDEKTIQIRGHKDFPDHVIEYMNKYMKFQNDWAFSDFNKYAKSRMIKGSMRLGANYDIKEVLKDVAVHWQIDAKINIQWKGIQVMDTTSLQLLVGLHQVFGQQVVESKARKIIESIDKKIHGDKVDDPLLWSVAPGRAEGLPFRVLKEGETWTDNGRRGWIFTCPTVQEGRFDAVLEVAKKRRE